MTDSYAFQSLPLATPEPKPESVSEISARLKRTLEQNFRGVWVEGEVTGYKLVSSGHGYFSIKDANATLDCAFFGLARRPAYATLLKNGAKVRLRGSISVYPPRGSYQLIVTEVSAVGLGDLMLQFELLRQKLLAEGIFDSSKKKSLPFLPTRIGVVTSPTGAVIRDILTVTRRRFPYIHLLLSPCLVQGATAAPSIVNALRLLTSLPPSECPDTIIVARGGGSMEDLWCFNDESVVRAVHACDIPIISAVGHETDTTLCDLASDVRAATPSAAAELAVPRFNDLSYTIQGHASRLANTVSSRLANARSRLDGVARSAAFSQPLSLVQSHMQRVDLLDEHLHSALKDSVASSRLALSDLPSRLSQALLSTLPKSQRRLSELDARSLSALQNRLNALKTRLATLDAKRCSLDPMSVLSRGYSMVKDDAGNVVSSAASLAAGDTLHTIFRDGSVDSIVIQNAAPRKASPRKPAPAATDSAPTPSPQQQTLF